MTLLRQSQGQQKEMPKEKSQVVHQDPQHNERPIAGSNQTATLSNNKSVEAPSKTIDVEAEAQPSKDALTLTHSCRFEGCGCEVEAWETVSLFLS